MGGNRPRLEKDSEDSMLHQAGWRLSPLMDVFSLALAISPVPPKWLVEHGKTYSTYASRYTTLYINVREVDPWSKTKASKALLFREHFPTLTCWHHRFWRIGTRSVWINDRLQIDQDTWGLNFRCDGKLMKTHVLHIWRPCGALWTGSGMTTLWGTIFGSCVCVIHAVTRVRSLILRLLGWPQYV